MTSFALKIVALISMFCDHFGAAFYSGQLSYLNLIGRIAFPIFAFQISEGYTHTKNIKKYFEYKDMYLILGILADKDVEDMVKVITPKAKKVFTVTPNSMRAETAEELMNEVKKYNESCEAYNDYKNAFEDALKLCKKDDLLLISGSLYMIGEMRGIIKKYFSK